MTTETILLVEDDENDAFFFERAIKKAGLKNPVRNAWDGQEAINYLSGEGKFAQRADFPFPALILLDLKLPFVMGLDVLKWIRQNVGFAPIVIVLSSSAGETDVDSAYRSGANAYLVKPSEASKLEGMVRAINDFWLQQNTPPSDSRAKCAPGSLGNSSNRPFAVTLERCSTPGRPARSCAIAGKVDR